MNSINHFFKEIGCHFQCYNVGRLIQPIDKQHFIDFEQNQQPWYSPFLQQAWLAIVFWQEPQLNKEPQANEHTVWFLKLPLDEQAKLNLVARDDFLRRLLSVLGKPQQSTTEKLNDLENALKDNPYGFQPKEEQLANVHAIVHCQFSLPASHYYKAAQKYFSDNTNLEQWHQLGLQGIADFVARLDESYNNKTNKQLLINSIKHLPLPVWQTLGNSLENYPCPEALTQAIYNRLKRTLKQTLVQDTEMAEQVTLCTTAIRATAQTPNQSLQQQLLSSILESDAGKDIEVLATIAGRCWTLMTNSQFLSVFLEALARTDSLAEQDIQQQAAFNSIISDLMFIPGLRKPILEKFRSQERSPVLTQAIGAFFQQNFKKA